MGDQANDGSMGRCTRFADVTDGLSNTVAVSERVAAKTAGNRVLDGGISTNFGDGFRNQPSQCLTRVDGNGNYIGDVLRTTGTRWPDGQVVFTGFTTVLGPNKPSCHNGGGDENDAIVDPTSQHTGGVQVLMGDGSVRFISENISTGNTTLPGPTGGQDRRMASGARSARSTAARRSATSELSPRRSSNPSRRGDAVGIAAPRFRVSSFFVYQG